MSLMFDSSAGESFSKKTFKKREKQFISKTWQKFTIGLNPQTELWSNCSGTVWRANESKRRWDLEGDAVVKVIGFWTRGVQVSMKGSEPTQETSGGWMCGARLFRYMERGRGTCQECVPLTHWSSCVSNGTIHCRWVCGHSGKFQGARSRRDSTEQ